MFYTLYNKILRLPILIIYGYPKTLSIYQIQKVLPEPLQYGIKFHCFDWSIYDSLNAEQRNGVETNELLIYSYCHQCDSIFK